MKPDPDLTRSHVILPNLVCIIDPVFPYSFRTPLCLSTSYEWYLFVLSRRGYYHVFWFSVSIDENYDCFGFFIDFFLLSVLSAIDVFPFSSQDSALVPLESFVRLGYFPYFFSFFYSFYLFWKKIDTNNLSTKTKQIYTNWKRISNFTFTHFWNLYSTNIFIDDSLTGKITKFLK